MALSIGTKPSTWDSVLTGLTQRIYDNKVSDGIFKGSSQITVTIDGTTYTESVSNRNTRVLNNKLVAYDIAKGCIDEIINNAEVTGIPPAVANSLPPAVTPSDGGATGFTNLKIALSADVTSKGGVE